MKRIHPSGGVKRKTDFGFGVLSSLITALLMSLRALAKQSRRITNRSGLFEKYCTYKKINSCKANIVGKITSLALAKTPNYKDANCKRAIFCTNEKQSAFTLSEVLISLVVIGIIVAITVPVIHNHYKWKQYKSGTLKAFNALNQGYKLWHLEKGSVVQCYYSSSLPKAGSECQAVYEFFREKFNTVKVCTSNAYANGCIPKYEGIDTVHKQNNPTLSDEEVAAQIDGCRGLAQTNILNGQAFITADGMIFFPYPVWWTGLIAVDVNGFKGPNKWGHDVRIFMPRAKNISEDPMFNPGGCDFIEKGGISTKELLYEK